MSFSHRLLKLVTGLALLVLSALPLSIPAALLAKEEPFPPQLTPIIWGLTLVTISAFLAFGTWQSYIKWDKIWLQVDTWLIAVLAFGGIYLVNLIGLLLMQVQGVETTANQEAIQGLIGQLPKSLMAILLVIHAPISEEIIYRGVFPKVFTGRFALWGHVASTLLFAGMHGPTNLSSWVIYAGMGAVFAYVRYRTKRLEPAILGHALNNYIAFNLLIST